MATPDLPVPCSRQTLLRPPAGPRRPRGRRPPGRRV